MIKIPAHNQSLQAKRDPRFIESETYISHKDKRKKTRADKATGRPIYAASEFAVDLNSKKCVCPAGKELLYTGEFDDEVRGIYSRFRGRLKDWRACSLNEKCMKKAVKVQGRQVQFLNEDKRRTSYLDLMKQKIDSEAGRRQYAKRMWMIEPVFGNITSNKGLNRISLRGKKKVTGQWLLYCMVHNLEKLWRYGPELKAAQQSLEIDTAAVRIAVGLLVEHGAKTAKIQLVLEKPVCRKSKIVYGVSVA